MVVELRAVPNENEKPEPFADFWLLYPPELADSTPRHWKLTIPGEPVAKGRPKLGTVAGHAMAFTPAKTRSYEAIVRHMAYQTWKRPIIAPGIALCLSVTFYRAIPASWSKRKQQQAAIRLLRPTGRPDLDNCVKSITDGLNGVVYADDAAIVHTSSDKFYSHEPRVELTLTW